MKELRYCEGNIGLDDEAEDGEGGTLVEPGRLSGEEEESRDIPALDSGRRVSLSGDGIVASLSLPYSEVGLRLRDTVDASGEVGTDVWDVVTERAEFSDETEEPVELGLILSNVLERRNLVDGAYEGKSEVCA